MRRREFMTLVSAVTATWPLAAPPQGSFSRTSRMHALWLALVCVAFGATWSAPIHAHDIYSNVLDKNGKPCCDQIDCRPAHFQVTPAGVKMLVHATWITVPNDLIQYRSLLGDTGETAGGHWCGIADWGMDNSGADPALRTFCAILPANLALISPIVH